MTESEFTAFQASRQVRQPTAVAETPKLIEKRRGRMNKTETLYAQEVLEPRKLAGEITKYWYESFKLRLATGAWFTVDFVVMTPQGVLEFHEVKGHVREASMVRVKVAAEMYPFMFVMCFRRKKKDGGGWKVEQF